MNTKILVVEDNAIVAFELECALKLLNYEVTDTVSNYNDALKSVQKDEPTLILMDIDLKNSKDGIQTTKAIQKIKDIPVIYLTAYFDDDTIKRAVETNPIGYLIKPFKREELKSTILLGLYRLNDTKSFDTQNSHIKIGQSYFYDMTNQILLYKDMMIKLSKREKALLTVLLLAQGNVVQFKSLESYIWPDKTVSSSTIRSLIHRLRTKMEYKFIETIPEIGCRIKNID